MFHHGLFQSLAPASSTSPDRVALKVPMTSRRLWISWDVDNVEVVCFGVDDQRIIKGWSKDTLPHSVFQNDIISFNDNYVYIFELVYWELWVFPVPEKSETCSPAGKSSFWLALSRPVLLASFGINMLCVSEICRVSKAFLKVPSWSLRPKYKLKKKTLLIRRKVLCGRG